MNNMKRLISLVGGLVISVMGWQLRMNATEMAWPSSYSYSGAREDTIWAIREQAYIDMGMILVYFGMAVLFMVFINWLWSSDAKVNIKKSISDTQVNEQA